MARTRAFHQKFFISEHCLKLSFFDRLFFLGLIAIANDYGKLKSHPAYLKSAIFPYDSGVTLESIQKSLKKLENEKMVMSYEVEGSHWCMVINWKKYQNPNHPGKDEIPNPFDGLLETFLNSSGNTQETFSPVVVVGVGVGVGVGDGCTELETGGGTPAEKTAVVQNEVFLVFPTNGKAKEWTLTKKRLSELKELYPAVDVEAECRRARDWAIREPQKRKTPTGMNRFLASWLERAQNKPNVVKYQKPEVIF